MSGLDLSGILRANDPLLTSVATSSGLRSSDPKELKQRLVPELWNYGITRVANLTGFDRLGIPVHMATKPQGKTLSSGSGKGVTAEGSWVSAVMEACEQTVWENLTESDLETSEITLSRMGVPFISGDSLPKWKGELWNTNHPIHWRRGWDIMHGETVYFPEAAALITPDLHSPFVCSSNGLASGAHVVEALLSGLQEVVERDSMTLKTIATRSHPVDATEFLREHLGDLMEPIWSQGLDIRVVDATTELGVPTMVAYLLDELGGTTGLFKGAGAGVSTKTAMVRAVTEAVQARCLVVAGARDDIFASQRRSSVSRPRQLEDEPTDGILANVMDASTGSVDGDLDWMVGKLRDQGIQRIVVDRHTEPGEIVQVVRVIVPHLEGYPLDGIKIGKRGRDFAKRMEGLVDAV